MRRSRTDVTARATRGYRAAAGARWLALALAACTPAPAKPAPPSCPTDHAVVISSQADIGRLAGCTTLRGVTIRSGGALDTTALRALTTITGDLVIGPTVAVEDVTLGALRTVDGAVRVVGNGLLQGLFLPQLERAAGITVDGNVAVTTISLPRLAAVGGGVRITDNASLELVDIPALASIAGELVVTGAPKLTLVESAELRRAGPIELVAPKLPPELVERLRALTR